jgi:hypothetical protein
VTLNLTINRVFGLIILGSSFNMPVVARDFYFIQTGMGKGCFNLFCGLLMCCDIDEFYSKIMAFCMIISGITFIFLSRCRHMSDEQLNRATSIATKELKKKA